MEENNKNNLFGCLPQALLGNFLVDVIFWGLGLLMGGPYIYIEFSSAFYIFLTLIGSFVVLTGWSIYALIKNHATKNLAVTGPYHYVRHPMYAAIIFLLNAAIGILLHSWLLIIAILPVYIIWKRALQKEEKKLAEKFGQDYSQYQKEVKPLVPNLWRLNKTLFYVLAGLATYIIAFIFLNFSAIYLRWVFFEQPIEKPAKITYDALGKQPPPSYFEHLFNNTPAYGPTAAQAKNYYRSDYTDRPDSIIISKINIQAPLVIAQGTSQKELNDALNQGVIIYPGSVMPGQRGEVFLSGHSSIYPWVKTNYGQVFTLLDKLEVGDTVSLFYNHTQYEYRVTVKQILTPENTKLSATNDSTLTLMTCWPIGTSLQRLVIRGALIR